MNILYGIKNCDTVKKARKWLDTQQHSYQFHDFRADGLEREQVTAWADKIGLLNLINKRSTTWKALSDQEKATFDTSENAEAVALITANPTLIKRPLLCKGEDVFVGFKEDQYNSIFS